MDTTCNSQINLVITLISFGVIAYGQNARITAPDRFILNTERIQIDCQPAGSLYTQISAVAILKNNQPMVNVGNFNGQSTIVWQDSSVQSRATTNTPDLSVVSSSQLRITIEATNTQCNDEAVYTCRVNGLDSGFNIVQNNEVSHNVTVVVKPDRMNDMQISPQPSAAGHYSKGENITLSCTGTVGAYTDPPGITWCIQRSGDFNPRNLESDNYFRSFSQSNAQSVGSGPTTSCQFERTSTVVYQVANIDSHTIFFCQITAPGDSGICGQGTVRQQKRIEVDHTTQPPGSGITESESTGKTNIGLLVAAIIGGVVSLTLAVILVVLVVYIVYRRKHKRIERAATINQNLKENMAYETLDNRATISEVSVYNVISNTVNATGHYLQSPPTYDKLDGTQRDGERNTYQVLTYSRNNAEEINTEYEIPNSN